MTRVGDTTLGTRVAKAAVISGLFGDGASTVRIGRYVVERSLGRGAQGEVFLALDTELRRRVALKVVPMQGPSNRMLDEARALARVEHRHVVRLFDVGRHADGVFLAMAFIEGETLAAAMRRQDGFTPPLRRIMREAAEGLSAIHDAGLVHRDFKPANVLVDRFGCARIADFGLALATGRQVGEVVGTLGYVAPEQLAGEAEPRSDQYAYCVTLFEIVTGRLPHRGATVQALLQSKQQGSPPLPVGTPRALVRVLRCGLSPRPEHRFTDLRTLQDALESTSRWWVVPALPLVAAFAAGFGAGEPPPHPCAELEPPRWTASLLPPEGETTTSLDTINAIAGDYVAAWTEARTRICGGEAAPAAVACLGERVIEFTSTVETLADRPADASSVSAMQSLGSPASCDDDLSSQARPLVHAEVRAAVVRSRVLALLGDDEAACAVACDAQQRVLETTPGAWGESEFSAAHQRAVACAVVDPADSLQAAERGYLAALSVDQPQWAAAMATHYADTTMRNGGLDEARAWLRHAEAALDRAGWPARDALPYLNVLGNLALAEGEYAQAADTYAAALELAERGTERASLAYNRAVAISEISTIEQALHAFEYAYVQLRDARGLESTAALTCAVAVSSLHVSRGDHQAAQAVLDEALQAARRSLSPQAYATGRLLEVLAVLHYERKAFEASAEAASEAVEILAARRGDEHPATARVRVRLGLALTGAGRPVSAIAVLTAAVVSLEVAPDQAVALGGAWTALSEAKRQTLDVAGAIADARRAIDLLDEDGGSDGGAVGDAHHQLALALEASGAETSVVRASLVQAVSAFEASVTKGYAHTEVLADLRQRMDSERAVSAFR